MLPVAPRRPRREPSGAALTWIDRRDRQRPDRSRSGSTSDADARRRWLQLDGRRAQGRSATARRGPPWRRIREAPRRGRPGSTRIGQVTVLGDPDPHDPGSWRRGAASPTSWGTVTRIGIVRPRSVERPRDREGPVAPEARVHDRAPRPAERVEPLEDDRLAGRRSPRSPGRGDRRPVKRTGARRRHRVRGRREAPGAAAPRAGRRRRARRGQELAARRHPDPDGAARNRPRREREAAAAAWSARARSRARDTRAPGPRRRRWRARRSSSTPRIVDRAAGDDAANQDGRARAARDARARAPAPARSGGPEPAERVGGDAADAAPRDLAPSPSWTPTLPAASATTRRRVCCPFGRAETSTAMLPAPSEAPLARQRAPDADPCRHWTRRGGDAGVRVVGRPGDGHRPGPVRARSARPGDGRARPGPRAATARTSVASDAPNGPPLRTVTRTAWRPDVSPASGTGDHPPARRGRWSCCGGATRRDSPPSVAALTSTSVAPRPRTRLQGVGRREVEVEAVDPARSARRGAATRRRRARPPRAAAGLGVTATLPARVGGDDAPGVDAVGRRAAPRSAEWAPGPAPARPTSTPPPEPAVAWPR